MTDTWAMSWRMCVLRSMDLRTVHRWPTRTSTRGAGPALTRTRGGRPAAARAVTATETLTGAIAICRRGFPPRLHSLRNGLLSFMGRGPLGTQATPATPEATVHPGLGPCPHLSGGRWEETHWGQSQCRLPGCGSHQACEDRLRTQQHRLPALHKALALASSQLHHTLCLLDTVVS